eukprot:10759394-Lingulodinium_polyedra.AAC.1
MELEHLGFRPAATGPPEPDRRDTHRPKGLVGGGPARPIGSPSGVGNIHRLGRGLPRARIGR